MATCGCSDHRIIIGDDGYGGYYRLDQPGAYTNQSCHVPCTHFYLKGLGKIEYYHNSRFTATQAVALEQTGNKPAVIMWRIHTHADVDQILDMVAEASDQEPWNYTYISNDCGTFANQWMKFSRDVENALYPEPENPTLPPIWRE